MSVSDIRNMRLWRSALQKLHLRRLSCTHDFIMAGATKSGRPAEFYLSAAACSAFTILWSWPPAEAIAASQKSDVARISITDAYVEPSEKLVRRGSADIKLENTGLAILHSIKCADGSVAHVYFPPRREADGFTGLVNHDLTIRAPELDLTPGAALGMSPDAVPGHPEYIDDGHLVFSGGKQSSGDKSEFLSCTFYFTDFDPVNVSFSLVKSIEDLHDF